MSFTRGWYRLTAESQQIANAKAGATTFFDAKADKVGWEFVVNQAPDPPVKGRHDTIFVYLLALLPNADRSGKMTPAAQLTEIMHRTGRLGTVIVETATGYRSDNRTERKKMIAFAHESIRLGNRTRVPDAKRGRRKTEFAPEVEDAGHKVWLSKHYATDDIAAAHLPKGMSKKIAGRLYGPSGRLPSRKPQQKRRT